MPFLGDFGKWGLGVGVMDFEVGGTMFGGSDCRKLLMLIWLCFCVIISMEVRSGYFVLWY